MLKTINIIDFQSHKNTLIELDPCFTVIHGSSGTGKSAFLRALNSLFYNNLTGTSYVRIGSEKDLYKIVAEIDNGTYIVRTKGTDVNGYTLKKSDGSAIDFNTVKTDVPEEVGKVLNIRPVPIDTNKHINIQYCGQFDSPFMLMEAAPTKMKFLNTLSGTAIVDLAVKASNALVTKNKRVYETTDLEIKKLELEQARLEHKASALETANQYIEKRYTELKALKEKLKYFQELKQTSDALELKFKKLNKLAALFAKYDVYSLEQKIDKLMILQRLYTAYNTLKSNVNAVMTKSDLLNKVNVASVQDKLDKLSLTRELDKSYNKLAAAVKQNSMKMQELTDTLSSLKTEYIAGIKKLGICPVCKSNITADIVNHIEEFL